MNHFYISKKLNFVSSILNLISSLFLLILSFIIFDYHSSLLSNNYKSINTTDISTPISLSYPITFLNSNGYAKFFDTYFIQGFIKYWDIVWFLGIAAILSFIFKTIISIGTLISSYKVRSCLYMYLSILNIFLPFFGGLIGIYVWNSDKKQESWNRTLPLQWIRFKFKLIFMNIFSDKNWKKL